MKMILLVPILRLVLATHNVLADEQSISFPGDDGKVYNVSLDPSVLKTEKTVVYKQPKLFIYFSQALAGVPVETKYLEELRKRKQKLGPYLKILAHGWRGDKNSSSVTELKNAYLSKKAVVCIIDWSVTASNSLHIAAEWIDRMANEIVPTIETMIAWDIVKAEEIQLIGYDMGAHLMGMIGKKMNTSYINSITGLDPTQPFFEMDQPDKRLSLMDAKFVEVIHTSTLNLVGFRRNIGDVDFYVNGGDDQPTCGDDIFTCPHALAYKVYVEAIKNPGLYSGYPCKQLKDVEYGKCVVDGKTTPLGGLDVKLVQGIYYVEYPKIQKVDDYDYNHYDDEYVEDDSHSMEEYASVDDEDGDDDYDDGVDERKNSVSFHNFKF